MSDHLKKFFPDLLLLFMFLSGVGMFFYPALSDRWNDNVHSRIIDRYNEAVSFPCEKDILLSRDAAECYNEALRETGSYEALLHPEEIPGYDEALNITGTGIMGTITINKIGVELPIYHGSDADVLAKGAGHLEGTSLPIGGSGTHSVILAHSGFPGARLFTDLDRLSMGDIFVLNVLSEDLAYEVDQIKTVLPTEIEELYLQEGEDFCTLMTCTPYGVNTHRLLVRGHRVYLNASGFNDDKNHL